MAGTPQIDGSDGILARSRPPEGVVGTTDARKHHKRALDNVFSLGERSRAVQNDPEVDIVKKSPDFTKIGRFSKSKYQHP